MSRPTGRVVDPAVAVKLYAFDDERADLERVPLAARRALDLRGWKISLEDWLRLPLACRRALVERGGADAAPPPAGTPPERELAGWPASVQVRAVAVRPDPPADAARSATVRAYAPFGPLTAAIWSQLTELDRYALDKVAERVSHRRDGEPSGPEPASSPRLRAAYEEIVGSSRVSTHLRASGGVQMVRVGAKASTKRRAVAESRVTMSAAALEMLETHTAPKGDVLATARIAGIMAAKRTPDLIPLCHAISLTHVSVDIEVRQQAGHVALSAAVETVGKTGVEMEALVAVSTAALAIYDMLKGVDRAMQIGPTRLISKTGGASGSFGV